MIKNLQELETKRDEFLLFEALAGSRAYGTHHAKSDDDYRGIFILPAEYYLRSSQAIEQVSDERNDIVCYTLKRFLELAANANPNILEMLYMPEDCIRFQSPILDKLLKCRHVFMTKKAYASHVNYAKAQIKKAKGQNKWVNNPQPEKAPVREDFCWLIPRENEGKMPLRPIPIQESAVNLVSCHASSLEHTANLYRLYDFGTEAKGVFRGGKVVCESIAKEDEQRCCGLLIFNELGYDRAKKDHSNYWTWKKNRNENRWLGQEQGERDYDAKNMLHTIRLLMSAESILRDGFPLVRVEGEGLQLLCDIREGKFTYEHLMEQVAERIVSLDKLYEQSALPDAVNEDFLADLLLSMTQKWQDNRGK